MQPIGHPFKVSIHKYSTSKYVYVLIMQVILMRYCLYRTFVPFYFLDLFCGQMISILTCTKCDHRSVTFDPFLDLSLPIPRVRFIVQGIDEKMCLPTFRNFGEHVLLLLLISLFWTIKSE